MLQGRNACSRQKSNLFILSSKLSAFSPCCLLQEVVPPDTGATAPDLFSKTLDYVAALCVLLLKRKSIEFEGGLLKVSAPVLCTNHSLEISFAFLLS